MSELPGKDSLWERDDEVYRVMKVYEAHERGMDGELRPITLVKVILEEPSPHHCRLDVFQAHYTPYDPDAE